MAPDIQAAHEIWPQLASIVFVAHTENDYHRLLDLQDDLTAIVSGSGNAARHPLASLLEVVRALIEKYEAETRSNGTRGMVSFFHADARARL